MRIPIFQHIRVRITLWNILVFGGILGFYTIGMSWFFLYTLNHQLEAGLKEDLELVEQMLAQNPQGPFTLDAHEAESGHLERFLEIWSGNGKLLYRSKTLGETTLGEIPDAQERRGELQTRTVALIDGNQLRVASKVSAFNDHMYVIRLAVSEAEYFSDTRRFIIILFVAIPFGLALLSISAYRMARRVLKPIEVMAATSQRISAHDLDERIPVKNPHDELGHLAIAFNELLTRVQRSFEELKRFTADASHELRTPLTAIRSVGEVALQSAQTTEEYREVIGSMLEESSRLTHLVDSLLFLSRADAGKHELHLEEMDALHFVRETINLLSVLAEEKEQQLIVEGKTGMPLLADRTLLSHGLMNLLDNAIKFSPVGSKIVVTVHQDESETTLIDMADAGPGIPEDEQDRIFERFYRVHQSGGPGSGLGLAIARWTVEAHGGVLTVQSRTGSGSTFSITLPKPPRNLKHS